MGSLLISIANWAIPMKLMRDLPDEAVKFKSYGIYPLFWEKNSFEIMLNLICHFYLEKVIINQSSD